MTSRTASYTNHYSVSLVPQNGIVTNSVTHVASTVNSSTNNWTCFLVSTNNTSFNKMDSKNSSTAYNSPSAVQLGRGGGGRGGGRVPYMYETVGEYATLMSCTHTHSHAGLSAKADDTTKLLYSICERVKMGVKVQLPNMACEASSMTFSWNGHSSS